MFEQALDELETAMPTSFGGGTQEAPALRWLLHNRATDRKQAWNGLVAGARAAAAADQRKFLWWPERLISVIGME
jgi:hypothetical protein